MGLFWEQANAKPSRKINTMPEIPDTGWSPPAAFPRLGDAKVLALDVETYDPDLKKHGPGWARNRGHIVGVSIGADKDGRWYFPVRHELGASDNLNPEQVFRWLSDTLVNHKQPKVGANLLYDIGWLQTENVFVKGPLYDVEFAEALLCETGLVNLDHLGEKYCGETKTSDELYKWCADFYGGLPDGNQRANIYRSPPKLVGPYAESDVDLPLRILPKQWRELSRQNLVSLFEKENKMIPLLIAMRYEGVRVDLDKAEQVSNEIQIQIEQKQKELFEIAGRHIDVYASKSIAKAFDEIGLPYHKTELGNPSFTKDFLKEEKHPLAQLIIRIKELDKIKNVFIQSYILESSVNGRIHCQFHPLRNDEYGTRSGRYSSSNPNLQNIPSRDKILAPLIRGLFIPDIGHKQWLKFDFSQIEYRFLAHFAVGPMSNELRKEYNEKPNTDYHALTQRLVLEQTGLELSRAHTKNINFGFIYGMGKKHLAEVLGVTLNKATELFDAYHEGAPFARATMDYFSEQVFNEGYVSTIANRRSRFELFEPIGMFGKDRPPALPFNKAIKKYGPMIQRAQAHKALNRVLQGSAAELMKEVMWQCWDQGVFKETGLPKLTVHDELDFSDTGDSEKGYEKVKYIFENAMKLKVPILVDEEQGPDWGHVKEIKC